MVNVSCSEYMIRPFLNRIGLPKISSTWCLGGLLVASVLLAYWPVGGFAFLDFDDNDYVWRNPHVLAGLTWPGVVWAFTQFCKGNWHPLTCLSHMLDAQVYGLAAGGHHLTSLGWHVVNTVLVFVWLRGLTGFVGRSAVVAALFGLHPLHVESVAWISERKDVLSTFFFLLSLMAYTRYVRTKVRQPAFSLQPSAASASACAHHFSPAFFYALCLLFFAMGLMSKPMLVTLPFVLLLLDYWPLQRISASGFSIFDGKQLVLEKVPFFVLSAASCAITLVAQRSEGAVMAVKFLPVPARLENSLVAYMAYLGKMCWPASLAAYYPLKFPLPAGEVMAAAFGLSALSVCVFYYRRQHPFLLVGWLWYLGTLVPVIGLIQVGSQSMADRYTYIPLIGIFFALVWLVSDILSQRLVRRWLPPAIAIGVLFACWLVTVRQVRTWQNSETLARHALQVTSGNAMMHGLLGTALFEQHKINEAGEQFGAAANIWPDNVTAQYGLATVLMQQHRLDEALNACHTVLQYRPQAAVIYDLMGNIYSQQRKWSEASNSFDAALTYAPGNPVYMNNQAWLLATAPDRRVRDGAEAVRLAEEACRLTNRQGPMFLGTLAAAYAEAGRFADAINTAHQAITVAAKTGNRKLIERNTALLKLYQQNQAYHEMPGL